MLVWFKKGDCTSWFFWSTVKLCLITPVLKKYPYLLITYRVALVTGDLVFGLWEIWDWFLWFCLSYWLVSVWKISGVPGVQGVGTRGETRERGNNYFHWGAGTLVGTWACTVPVLEPRVLWREQNRFCNNGLPLPLLFSQCENGAPEETTQSVSFSREAGIGAQRMSHSPGESHAF